MEIVVGLEMVVGIDHKAAGNPVPARDLGERGVGSRQRLPLGLGQNALAGAVHVPARISQARTINIHPAFFHARTPPGKGRARDFPFCRHHIQIFSHSKSLEQDNSFAAAGFYLREHRLCSLHLGSFGSPFFPLSS